MAVGFTQDYSTRRPWQLRCILKKCESSLSSDRVRLARHIQDRAFLEDAESSEYLAHRKRYMDYIIQSTENDIEYRLCDIELIKAFMAHK